MKLMDGEEVVMELRPHPLAFMRYISICVYYLAIGFSFKWIYGKLTSMPILPSAMGAPLSLVVWLILMLLLPMLVSILHITFWPLLASALLSVLGAFLVYRGLPVANLSYLALLGGLLGLVLVEFYRRGHRYYITNQRLIMTKRFIFKDERFVKYEDITDLVVHQGPIGRLFGFGDVIPITPSGLGTGEGISMVMAGVRRLGLGLSVGGGRTIKVPRMRSFMGFFGVSNPEAVRDKIEEMKEAWRGVPYLRRIARATEELLELSRKRGPSPIIP